MGLSSVAASTGERYPPLGMRTLGQSLLVAMLLAVGMGTLAAQTDVEALRAKAEQGDASAQNSLGFMYSNGQGVPQNYAETVKWYRLAAEQGDADAQYNLGLMYANGEGVPQDYAEVIKWVNLAASTSQGETNEKYAKLRKLIAEKMTPAQIAEAQRLAREWKPKTWDELKQGLETESR
jgi:TPR repeat protein